MIICSCNVLSENEVRTTLTGATPPRTACQVYGQLGCRAQCGRCALTIKRIMREAHPGCLSRDASGNSRSHSS